jgi:predicted small metal-binding protein
MTLDEGRVSFRCSDLQQDCPWQVSGDDEEEIFPKIEEHGREKHNLTELDAAGEKKIRSVIRRQEAA